MNKKLAQLLAEHPDLPVKIWVDGELAGDDAGNWYIGELNDCEVTEYAVYDPNERIYFDRDDDDLWDYVRDQIWCDKRREIYKELSKDKVGYLPHAESEWDAEAARLADEALRGGVHNRLTQERIDSLDWQQCILVRVGV